MSTTQRVLLSVIRGYWRVWPGSGSAAGTSVEAHRRISAGAGLATFVWLALPVRKAGSWLGVYDGPHNW